MEDGVEMFKETADSLKAQMLLQLRLLGEATTAVWERAVFYTITGRTRDELDWSYEPNQAGYAHWVRSFGHMVAELLTEGAVFTEERDGKRWLIARPVGPLS